MIQQQVKKGNGIKDPFGNWVFLKRMICSAVGIATYHKYAIANKLEIEGIEHLKDLPNQNVMLIANHQTYFTDVIGFLHVAASLSWGYKKPLSNPFYLIWPRANIYYIAAEETMQDRRFTKLLSYVGAVTVKRSWRHKGEEVNRAADAQAPIKVKQALSDGWVFNFPQGTTTPYAPLRKGAAALVQAFDPILIPMVFEGFSEAFHKKGLSLQKKGVTMRIRIKPRMEYSKDEPIDQLLERMRIAIEQ